MGLVEHRPLRAPVEIRRSPWETHETFIVEPGLRESMQLRLHRWWTIFLPTQLVSCVRVMKLESRPQRLALLRS